MTIKSEELAKSNNMHKSFIQDALLGLGVVMTALGMPPAVAFYVLMVA